MAITDEYLQAVNIVRDALIGQRVYPPDSPVIDVHLFFQRDTGSLILTCGDGISYYLVGEPARISRERIRNKYPRAYDEIKVD